MGCGLHRTGEANRPYRCTFETECALCSHVCAHKHAHKRNCYGSAVLSFDYTMVAKKSEATTMVSI
jgi:hypothetical protein